MSQTHVLEYRIAQSADGTTPSPQFSLGSRAPDGIYVFEVDRLGLIDLSFSGIQPPALRDAPSSIGQRYVSWMEGKRFSLSSANPIRSANNVLGAGYVDVELLETLPIAAAKFYSRKGYIMPHGTVLRVQDMTPAVAGDPIVLRLSVFIPEDRSQDAIMRESFCCSEAVATIT